MSVSSIYFLHYLLLVCQGMFGLRTMQLVHVQKDGELVQDDAAHNGFQRPGVYVILYRPPECEAWTIMYIGEAKNMAQRIDQYMHQPRPGKPVGKPIRRFFAPDTRDAEQESEKFSLGKKLANLGFDCAVV